MLNSWPGFQWGGCGTWSSMAAFLLFISFFIISSSKVLERKFLLTLWTQNVNQTSRQQNATYKVFSKQNFKWISFFALTTDFFRREENLSEPFLISSLIITHHSLLNFCFIEDGSFPASFTFILILSKLQCLEECLTIQWCVVTNRTEDLWWRKWPLY